MIGEVASLNEGRYGFGVTATDLSFTHCEGRSRRKKFNRSIQLKMSELFYFESFAGLNKKEV